MWLVLALSAALFDGVKHIAAKYLTRSFDPLTQDREKLTSEGFLLILVGSSW